MQTFSLVLTKFNDLTSNQSKYAISFKINLSTKLLRLVNDMYLIILNLINYTKWIESMQHYV